MATYFVRHKKERDFTMVDNTYIRDEKLSLKAKGLFTFLLHLPEDWIIYMDELPRHFKDGRDAVRKAVQELVDNGYIKRSQKKVAGGRFGSAEYSIIEKPKSRVAQDTPWTAFPSTENPTSVNPWTDNPTLLSTNELSTNTPSTKDTLEPKGSGATKNKDDAVSKAYYDAIKALGVPIGNHNNLRLKIKQLEKEVGKDYAVGYLNLVAQFYPKFYDDGFKPQLNEALDIYVKRVAIKSWMERKDLKAKAPPTSGGRPLF